jgi:hypothetical protein
MRRVSRAMLTFVRTTKCFFTTSFANTIQIRNDSENPIYVVYKEDREPMFEEMRVPVLVF